MKTKLAWMRRIIAAMAVATALLPVLSLSAAADPNALWKIVHGNCVPDEMAWQPRGVSDGRPHG